MVTNREVAVLTVIDVKRAAMCVVMHDQEL